MPKTTIKHNTGLTSLMSLQRKSIETFSMLNSLFKLSVVLISTRESNCVQIIRVAVQVKIVKQMSLHEKIFAPSRQTTTVQVLKDGLWNKSKYCNAFRYIVKSTHALSSYKLATQVKKVAGRELNETHKYLYWAFIAFHFFKKPIALKENPERKVNVKEVLFVRMSCHPDYPLVSRP